jgi:hypothetical protein
MGLSNRLNELVRCSGRLGGLPRAGFRWPDPGIRGFVTDVHHDVLALILTRPPFLFSSSHPLMDEECPTDEKSVNQPKSGVKIFNF